MSASHAKRTCWIMQPFEVSLKLLHDALEEAGLSILAEFDVSGDGAPDTPAGRAARILHVDAPLLDFQALALDRAPAVFIPLHMLISAEGMRTRISWVDAAALAGARLPAGAATPMHELQARVARVVEAVAAAASLPADGRPVPAVKKGVEHYV
jgi:uncharacterized protein (DUF302 family)